MEKSNFTNLINSLSTIAEKDGWVTRYDKDLDYFYWTKESINKNAKLVKVSHEASLYVTPQKKIEGIFIEYLKDNFVEHNKSYAGLIKQFQKKVSGNIYTVSDKKKAEKYLFGLGQAVRADIYQDADKRGVDINFDKLISFAVSG